MKNLFALAVFALIAQPARADSWFVFFGPPDRYGQQNGNGVLTVKKLLLVALAIMPAQANAGTIPYKQAYAICQAEAVQSRPRHWGCRIIGMIGAAAGAARDEEIIRDGRLARYGYIVQTPR